MKIQNINPVLQPRLKRPLEWKQGAADTATVAVGSAVGAFLGPIAGGGIGSAAGAAAESLVVSDYTQQKSNSLIARQAIVGMASGVTAGVSNWLLPSLLGTVHPGLAPALSLGLGLVVGGSAAALLPDRSHSEVAGHWSNLETIEAPQLWKEGLTGQGVGVAVLDTGSAQHVVLEGHIAAFHSFVEDDQQAHDAHSHGTCMAGIISGHGKDQKYPAVAPNSQLIVLQVADAAGKVQTDKVAEAIRWATENRQRYNIQVINMSFAADPGDDPVQLAEISKAVDEASAQGLIVVASAGNDGPEPSPMQAPAAATTALAAASLDCQASPDPARHLISEFSHRSPQGSAGPTVSAPGTHWLQPVPGGQYAVDSGTSQAAAALSGVMALWKQALPDLTAEQAKAALEQTSNSLHSSKEAMGAGAVRAQAGLDYLRADRATLPG